MVKIQKVGWASPASLGQGWRGTQHWGAGCWGGEAWSWGGAAWSSPHGPSGSRARATSSLEPGLKLPSSLLCLLWGLLLSPQGEEGGMGREHVLWVCFVATGEGPCRASPSCSEAPLCIFKLYCWQVLGLQGSTAGLFVSQQSRPGDLQQLWGHNDPLRLHGISQFRWCRCRLRARYLPHPPHLLQPFEGVSEPHWGPQG